jgi:glycosyltransferase involved in cell wall biosynthesis
MAPISVIIPSYRNPSYLDLCLKSLVEGQKNTDNQIIVVLDGFGSESYSVLEKYPNVDVLEFDENKGQTYAHNHGVINAQHKQILILNDDNVAPRQWDKTLNYVNISATIVAPNQVEPVQSIFRSFIHGNYGTTPDTFEMSKFLDFADVMTDSAGELDGSRPRSSQDGQTWPVFMLKKHWMILGGIDPYFPHPAVADWDFFMRAEMMGLNFERTFLTHFYHFAGASTRKTDASWSGKEAESFEYFEYKWNFRPSLGVNHSKLPRGKTSRGVTF